MVKKNKKIISLVLSIALAVSVLSGAITSSANEDVVYEECTYVNQFRKNESGQIEEASYAYPAKDGYVFSGWYQKNGSEYLPLSEAEANNTDAGYAKYVKKDVLGIKYQFERDKTTGSETIDLRMLTSVDCLDYESVGFIYSIGGVRKEVRSDTVYERVLGYADSEGKVYEPSVFSQASKYFMSYTVNDIQKSEYGQQVELIPKWVTKDGTVVIGKGTVFTLQEEIADFYNGLGFENEMDQQVFTGQGVEGQDATIEKVAYADAEVTAPANGENYALKLSHDSFSWPKFRIYFGEELAADTKISFQAYGKLSQYTSIWLADKGGQSKFEIDTNVATISGDLDGNGQFSHEGWKNIIITLNESATYIDMFWNCDVAANRNEASGGNQSQTILGEVYIDNVRIGTGGAVVSGQPDIYAGFDFEIEDHVGNFVGQGIEGRDATIERVNYDSLGVGAPTNGGDYALKLSHASNYWPTFRIHFGRELAAGTKITFMAYGKITSGTNKYNQSIFEYMAGGEATAQFKCDVWTELTMTLPTTGTYVDLYWNYDRASITSQTASGEVYIDNMKIEGITEGDIYEGFNFEGITQIDYFVGQGIEGRDATIERVNYDSLGVGVPTNGGNYALKLSHASNYWPTFRIHFGRELAAGTKITFMAYGKITSGTNKYNQSIFEYMAGGEATAQFKCDAWTELTMTLPSAGTYVDLYWNYDRASITSQTASGEVYIDNFRVVIPITEGVDFEEEEDANYFVGQGKWQDAIIERVSYATSEITLLENGGNYVLKLRGEKNLYPTFRINFEKELPAGTKITFNAFAKIYEMNLYNKSMFKFSQPEANATKEFKCGSWETVSFILPSSCDSIDMFWDFGQAQGASLADGDVGEVYIDNITVIESFATEVNFESESDVSYFKGQGVSQDATIERIDYSSAGISALTDGGSYALKLSHASNKWPTFRIDFGKKLLAGTKITFMAYGTIEGETLYNQSIFEYSAGGEATAQFTHDGWKELTITVPTDCEYLNLFWNFDRAGIASETASGAVYIDNIVVSAP